MRTRLILIATLLIGLIHTTHSATASTSKQADTGSIAGKVTAEDTDLPIGGIYVSACLSGSMFCYSGYVTSTKPDGTYEINEMNAGTYGVGFSQVGPGAEFEMQSTVVTITAGVQLTNINVALKRIQFGSISGRVTASHSGQPLGGIAVSACKTGTDCFETFNTTTLTDGAYLIPKVPPGPYLVRFNTWAANGFLGTTTQTTVTANAETSNVNAVLIQGGVIAGHVTLLAPVTGSVMLRLYRLDAPPELSGFPVQSVVLQGSGEYAFNDLTPSDAYIVQLTVSGYPDYYFNNQWSRSRASIIRVTAGVTTTNVDFTLNVLGSISGQLTSSENGQPISGVNVTANGPSGAFYTSTGPSGTYQFDGLPLGQYRLSFFENASPPRYQSRTYDQAGPDVFSPNVVTLDATNPARVVNLSLKPSGQVDVKLVTEDGGNPDALAAFIQLPVCYSSFVLRSEITGTTQTIMGVPDGRRHVFVYPVPAISGLGRTDYYADGADVDVRAPAVTTTTILLKRGGAIAGRVVSEGGAGINGVPIYARGPVSQRGYAVTSYDGAFAIQGLPPSAYTLTVNAQDDLSSEYISTTATNVVVSASQTQTLSNIVLQKGSKILGSVKGAPYTPSYAQVELLDSNDNVIANTEAKNEAYSFQGIASGSYRVRFNGMWPDGMWSNALNLNPYMAQYYDGQALSSTATLINIPSTPVTLTNVSAVLVTGGRIAGAVLDAFGIAMQGVRILVYDTTNTLVSKGLTEADGTFLTSPALPTGQYKVRFDYTDCLGRRAMTAFYKAGAAAQTAQSVSELAASFDDATPVNVVLGQVTRGINAVVVPDGFSITGRVTDKGAAVPNFKLTLTNGSETSTDAGGYYTFTAVYTGTLALAPAAGMSATTPATRNVVVGPNAINQDFSVGAVAATYSIGGRVLRNGIGVAGYKLNLSNGAQITTDAGGNFSVSGLPAGIYTITPAAGQLPVAPASRSITVPPSASNSDFTVFQIMTPVVVR